MPPAHVGAQGDQRIDAHRTARRDPAGRDGYGEQGERDRGVGQRIDCPDSVEQRRQESAEREGARQADRDAGERGRDVLPQHQRTDRRALRAHGHPDADLLRALADGVRGHAVNPDRRQQQRDHCEPGEQRRLKPRLAQRIRQLGGERRDAEQRQLWIERLHFAPDRRPSTAAGSPAARNTIVCVRGVFCSDEK